MTTREGTSNDPNEREISQDPGLESGTSTGEDTDEGQNIQSDPLVTPEPVDPYAGTRMEGKSPEEVKAYMALLESTVQEQSTALTRAATPPPPPEPREEVDFFSNPREVIRQELETMVKPINDSISAFTTREAVSSAWEQARGSISDFSRYEPYINKMLEGQNIRPEHVTTELLKSLYYTAVGFVARHGGTPTGENTMGHPQSRETRQATPPIGVPQHRPSSAPLPSATPATPKIRKLTENEARLAREWGMTPEQYIAYQDAEAEDVLTLDFGGNNG